MDKDGWRRARQTVSSGVKFRDKTATAAAKEKFFGNSPKAEKSTRREVRFACAALHQERSSRHHGRHDVLRYAHQVRVDPAVSARSHRSRRRAIPDAADAKNLNPEGPSAYRRRGRGFRIRAAGGAGEPLTPNATARSHTGCRRRTESAVSSRRAPISSPRRTHRLTSARHRLRHRSRRVAPAALGSKMSSKLNGASRRPHTRVRPRSSTHPEQSPLVPRARAPPARVRGPGTGVVVTLRHFLPSPSGSELPD